MGVKAKGHEVVWSTGEHPWLIHPWSPQLCQKCAQEGKPPNYCRQRKSGVHVSIVESSWEEAHSLRPGYFTTFTAPRVTERTVVFDLGEECELFREEGEFIQPVRTRKSTLRGRQYDQRRAYGHRIKRFVKLDEDLAYLGRTLLRRWWLSCEGRSLLVVR